MQLCVKYRFMKKYLLGLSILTILLSCKVGKTDSDEISTLEKSEDSLIYGDNLDESYDDLGGEIYDLENEVPVRGIYNPSKTILTDLIHTKLEVNFNWEKSQLNGKATITAKQHFQASDSLILDAKGMDIIHVEMGGKPVSYVYNDSLKLRIKLDKKYNRDEKFTVSITYVSKPEERQTSGSAAITSDKGLYFINPKNEKNGNMPQIWTQGETESNSVWFPTIDSPNSKSTQEMYITVLDKYITLSNGKLLSSKKNADGTRTDYWKQELQHAPYLFMLAVGEFKVVKDSYTRPNGSKMEVNYYVEPEYEQNAKSIFGETPSMIKFFSQKLGVEYPWDKYSQIVVRDYVSGAMENTGAVVFGEYVYKNDRELLDGNDQSTIAHELFHHWFGDLVTCESWANLPLNESFANYSQYLWDEYRYGLDEADYQAEQEAIGYFESAMNQGYHNLIYFDHYSKEDMFDGHSYNKGGRILHMLRNYLGDEAFFKGLNNYLVTNKFKTAEVHNLRMAFEEVSGEDLNWFFNQWFLAKGHPIIHTTQTIDKENSLVSIQVKQRQKTNNFPVYKIPVNVAIWDSNGKRIEKIVIDSVEQSFSFKYSGEIQNVLLDADQVLLGKYFEDKPISQFVHQYYNSSRYRSKFTALKRASKVKNDATEKMIFDAMNDSFWNIRLNAISLFDKVKNQLSEQGLNRIKEIAINDAKPQVRAEAINYLKILPESEAVVLFKKIIEKDQSYLVIATALQALMEVNSDEALAIARKLEKDNNKNINLVLADIYGQKGSVQENDFFHKQIKEGNLKGYDEVRMVFGYAVYVMRMEIDLIEKSHEIFTYLSEKGGSNIKMYLSRIIDYNLNAYREKVNTLEMEITQLEEEKAFGQADDKRRIKQRYEDLINNLSTLVDPNDLGY
jgi:aminopeptidase N